jgi:hypothetical protein
MFERLNIFSNKTIFDLVQSLKDYDVDFSINMNLVQVSSTNIPKDKIILYSKLVDRQVAKYEFSFRKESFDNNSTIKIYHELNVLLKKLKSIGCDAEISENDKLIIVLAIPVDVDNLV